MNERRDARAFVYLARGEEEEGSLSFEQVDLRARAIAAALQEVTRPDDRVLLVHPPGLDFVTGFLGALYAGRIAVPAAPPSRRHGVDRLAAMVADCGARTVLTSASAESVLRRAVEQGELPELEVMEVDRVPSGRAAGWRDPEAGPEDLALLQYTSGSTSDPKGVMVTHGNLVQNEEAIRRAFGQTERSVVVSWLPPFHDMGLIGGVLQPLYVGGTCVLMAPAAFLQKPVRWLRTIQRYGGTTSGGPDFAYELCVRRIRPEDRRGLDLSTWAVAFDGSEPVRAETLRRFSETFAPHGFDRTAFFPCYGLAEATLFVAGGDHTTPPVVETVRKSGLEEGRAMEPAPGDRRALVGCGSAGGFGDISIVDPETSRPVPAGTVGEIWFTGPSVATGYWNRPEKAAETFGARLREGGGTSAKTYLRTGDLGFVRSGSGGDEELFVTGRLKDLIIVRGRNHYPHDIERTAERSHPDLRAGGAAAFSADAGGAERLVVVQEVDLRRRPVGPEVPDALRQAVVEAHEVAVHDVVLVPAGTVPKTTSGKVRRSRCREQYLAGELERLVESAPEGNGDPAPGGVAAATPSSPAVLEGLVPEEWAPVVKHEVRRAAARAARCSPDEVRLDRPLTAVGLDSLAAAELQAEVEGVFGIAPDLAQLLGGATVAELSGSLCARLAAGGAEPAAAPATADATAECPLSPGQRGLWFLHRLSPESPAYNIAVAVRVLTPMVPHRLAGALERVVRRHPMLRTTFHPGSGPEAEPFLRVHDHLEPELSVHDLSARDRDRVRGMFERQAYAPFDVETGPLLRAALFTSADTGPDGRKGTWLVLAVHHLVADLRSMEILAGDLAKAYRAEEVGEPAEAVEVVEGYERFVEAQHRWVAGVQGETQWRYWRDRLGTPPAVPLDLPTDFPRPPLRSGEGGAAALEARRLPVEAVRRLAVRRGTTPAVVLLAGLATLLHRYTGQDDLVIGMPWTGRRPSDSGVVGYFVNPLPIRIRCTGGSFADLVDRVRAATLEALENRDLPFSVIAERLHPEQDPSRTPVFQAMFVFQGGAEAGGAAALTLKRPGLRLEMEGLEVESVVLPERGAQMDVGLNVTAVGDFYEGFLQYDTALFRVATAVRMTRHLLRLLRAALDAPDRGLSALPMITPAEEQQIVREWAGRARRSRHDAADRLHDRVAERVRRQPDAIAVVHGTERWSYRMLELRSAAVAARLTELGLEPETRIGLLFGRSCEMVAGALGILAAGGAYVAMDPDHPDRRLTELLEDSGARVLLTDREHEARGGEVAPDGLPLCVCDGAVAENGWPAASAGELAYLLYTSGSTGRPKGVAIGHYAACALIDWAGEEFSPEELAGVLASTSVTFDLSVFEIFATLAVGGKVVLAEDALSLAELPAAYEVTLVNTVPSAMAELVRRDAVPSSTIAVNLAGEPLRRVLVDLVYAAGGVERLRNLYGPSEDTTYSTWSRVPPEDGAEPTIGRPVDGTSALILARSGTLAPIGVPGELALAGAGVARGYHGRPALTAEQFVPYALGGGDGRRIYRTGDLARWRTDGRIEFLGRLDHQLKIRGHRIEPGEVEVALGRQSGVEDVAVVARTAPGGDSRLVAYVVPEADASLEPEELSRSLHRRLPPVMVPSVFVILDALPLTPNGKVDRRALPEPSWRAEAAVEEDGGPSTETEVVLAELWREVLGIDEVGPGTDFFRTGGHSLLAARLATRVNEVLGSNLPLRVLFEAPTLRELAGRLERGGMAAPEPDGPRLAPGLAGDRAPLTAGQRRLWLAERMQQTGAAYDMAARLELAGFLDPGALAKALHANVVRHHVLRTRIEEVGGEPIQVAEPPGRRRLPVVDLSGLEPTLRSRAAAELAERIARVRFDPAAGHLLLTVLVRRTRDEHDLLLCAHHLVADGFSLVIFLRELAEGYAAARTGSKPDLPPLPLRYADYAEWQRRAAQDGTFAAAIERWSSRLDGAGALDLPADRPPPRRPSHRGFRVSRSIDPPVWEGAAALARTATATPFTILLAALAIVFSRHAGREDVVVGAPFAVREDPRVARLVGFLVNTLALRVEVGGTLRFDELLDRVRGAVLEADAVREVPFEDVLEAIGGDSQPGRDPLRTVTFGFEEELPVVDLPGLRASFHPLYNGTAKFDLAITARRSGEGPTLVAEASADRFEPTTIRRMLGQVEAVLEEVLATPTARVAEVGLLSDAARHQVLLEWNDTTPTAGEAGVGTAAGGAGVHRLVAERAAALPDSVAVIWDGGHVTYGELWRRAGGWCERLAAVGAGPERVVALYFQRSPHLVAAALGVLRAGAAYLPIDPAEPADRLGLVLEDAAPAAILADPTLAPRLPVSGPPVLAADTRLSGAGAEAAGTAPPDRSVHAEGLAYVIFTSGSTGRPKGTLLDHAGLANLVAWHLGAYRPEPGDHATMVAGPGFDASVWEVWPTLVAGGTLVVPPSETAVSAAELGGWLASRRIGTSFLPTPLAEALLRELDRTTTAELSLRTLLTGGDRLRDRPAEGLPFALVNHYGPTESTVVATRGRVGTGEDGLPDIGRPIRATSARVLDHRLGLCPPGVPGELCLAGRGTARGYLGRPALTAERFVPDPSGTGGPGGRLYRTGDVVRHRSDGRLEFLGRIDHQVKVRGHRIELGEVERVLARHPEVDGVVVAAVDGGPGARENALVAYLVPGEQGAEVSPAALREYLRERLPPAMVPTGYVSLGALPLTPSGKVDRRALPVPPSVDGAGREPRKVVLSAEEELLANLFEEVLGVPRVDREDSFFDLGGHSLLATRVVSRLRSTLGLDLPLSALFRNPSVRQLAGDVRELLSGGGGRVLPPVEPAPCGPEAPLSFSQERLWLLARMTEDAAAFNISGALQLDGAVRFPVLATALASVVARHEALRTRFPADRPVQVVEPPSSGEGAGRLPVVDLSGLSEGEGEAVAGALLRHEGRRGFDLARSPLFRALLLRSAPSRHTLCLTVHHIVADGWSMGVLMRDVGTFYAAAAGGEGPAPLSIQYRDFAWWQRHQLDGEVLEGQLRYWRSVLGDRDPPSELPTDRPHRRDRRYRGARRGHRLPVDTAGALDELCRREGVTQFMALFGVFQVLHHRLTGRRRSTVGTFVANRNRRETEDLVGFFVNNLALRTATEPGASFRELLEGVRDTTLGAYAHQDIPFERLLSDLGVERSPERTPLFQTMVVMQNAPSALPALGDAETSVLPVYPERANFDLTLWIERPERPELVVEYDRDLFDDTTAERLLRRYRTLLRAALTDRSRPIGALDLFDRAERHQVLVEWNDTERDDAGEPPVHEAIRRRSAVAPDAVAVRSGSRCLSYAELIRRAHGLAAELVSAGVGAGEVAGLLTHRSPETIVGLLGILAAGAVYLPLDPTQPDERLRWMIEDAGVRLLVSDAPAHDRAVGMGVALSRVPVDGRAATPAAEWNGGVSGERLAYLIYTSGSTGWPKAVMVRHGSLGAYVRTAARSFGLVPEDRVMQFASLAFDASAEEIYPCLLGGGTLVLRDDAALASPTALLDSCARQGITVLDLPTSYWHEVVSAVEVGEAEVPASLRLVILGGERAAPSKVEAWLREVDSADLVNTYGPTEATIVATSASLGQLVDRVSAGGEVPIGRPVANATAHVLDPVGRPVPTGVVGELALGGRGVARGYLDRPGLTADRFRPDPYAGGPGAVLYATGDLARRLPDGRLEFVGRRDRQVKLRGYRIELAEVEAALVDAGPVREAAVMMRTEGSRPFLAAYAVPRRGAEIDGPALRQAVRERLPEVMVPSVVVPLESMPLTSSGKIDREALPAAELTMEGTGEGGRPPEGPVEEALAEIWADVLDLPRVAADQSFFDLGGYSLLGMQVIARIREVFGVELPLVALFEESTVARLAVRIEESEQTEVPPVVPVPRDRPLPLSFAQERLWFLAQVDPDDASYHVPRALRMKGDFVLDALDRAYRTLIQRHEVLRTTFPVVDGSPVQRIHDSIRLPLEVVDLSLLEPESREEEVQRLIGIMGRETFDLADGPLLRVAVLRLDPEHHVLVQIEHHLVHDGWAEGVLLRDLLAGYAAGLEKREPDLPDLPVQFADFASWQRRWLSEGLLDRQLEYWRRTLEGAPPQLELPADRPRPAIANKRGHELVFRYEPEWITELERLARRDGVTLFMIMLAAFCTVAHRYTGRRDMVLGTGMANRRNREIEGLLGMVINTVPLRIELHPDLPFRQLLGRVRDVCLAAYSNQDVPFDRVVEAVRPPRSMSFMPVFQHLFAFQDAPHPELDVPGLEMDEILSHNRSAKFDMVWITVPERRAGLRAGIETGMATLVEYDVGLFDETTVRRFFAHFRAVMDAAQRNGDPTIGELDFLSDAERHQILREWGLLEREWSAHRAPSAEGQGLQHMVAAQVERTPDAVALVDGGSALSFRAFDRRVEAIARHLRRLGIGRGSVVGVCAERSLDLVLGLHGVVRAGAAYLPLDPDYPSERLAFMLEDAAVPVLLTQEHLLRGDLGETLRESGAEIVRFDADRERIAAEAAEPAEAASDTGALDAAYVIYTSGSTGRPKGVVVPHRGIVNRLVWMQRAYRLGGEDRVLQKTPFSFDVSVWELFWPLMVGARLEMAAPGRHGDPAYLAALLAERRISTLHFVPSMLQVFLEGSGASACGSVRRVIASGEALPRSLVERFFECFPEAELHNLYGPTEASVDVSHHPCRPGSERVPIGRPIENIRLHVLDPAGRPVPAGVPGELHLGGVGLARCYLGRPALTAERFVPDGTGAGGPGARLYRTGDLCRLLADGEVDFLGRIDFQVKVRGLRIELGEVEAVLDGHPAVREVVVVARDSGGADARLVAYLVPHEEEAARPSVSELRSWVGRSLPDYMIPSELVFLDALPLTSSGKIDRRALPEPDARRPELGQERVPPEGPTETVLASILEELLGRDDVGALDDFFELGGHSLLATRAVFRVHEAFGVEVPVRQLFETPTVRALAARVDTLAEAAGEPPLSIEPVDRDGRLPLSFAQERLWFLEQMTPGTPLYNIVAALDLRGGLSPAALVAAIAEVVERHEILRSTFRLTDGTPTQTVRPPSPPALPVVDLSGLSAELRRREGDRIARARGRRPFDLARGPLLRTLLMRLAADRHQLVFVLHHIVTDGWSTGILVREIATAYAAVSAGQPADLPELPIQYGDFATHQRRHANAADDEEDLSYWREQLASVPPVIELPTDRPRPSTPTYRGGMVRRVSPRPVVTECVRVGRSERSTLFMVLQAAAQALLARYSGENVVATGTVVANRRHPETRSLIGFFVNTLALATDLGGDPAFREVLARGRTTVLGGFDHQNLPFEQVVEALAPVRSTNHTPLFQVMVVLQQDPLPDAVVEGLQVRPMEVDTGLTKFDLTLSLAVGGDGLQQAWAYSRDVFDESTVRRVAGHFESLLVGALEAPKTPLSLLPTLSRVERHQALVEWNDTAVSAPSRPALPEHFRRRAERVPDRTAVVGAGEHWTYAGLARWSGALAAELHRLGAGPETRVGIHLDRSAGMVAAILGTLEAGATYVPLDPSWPVERARRIARDAGLRWIFQDEGTEPIDPGLAVLSPADGRGAAAGPEPRILQPPAEPDGAAYAIYTSGSTGRPKGVVVPHRAISDYAEGIEESVRSHQPDGSRATLSAAVAFDASLKQLTHLLRGDTLFVVPQETREDVEATVGFVRRHGIEILDCVPSQLEALLTLGLLSGETRPKVLSIGGEAIAPILWSRLAERSDVRSFNHYGPTECTVNTTVRPVTGERPTLGGPIRGVRVYLVDRDLSPVPAGVGGEIAIGGSGVSRGYLGRPAATAEAFVPDPFAEEPGARLYKTGDLGRRLPDGDLEFLRRIDHQVKVRGFRVELGEIESALREHRGIAGAVVVGHGGLSGETRLTAFFILEATGIGEDDAPTAGELREHLEGTLPGPMVPSVFLLLDAFPRTTSGKIDRRALAEVAGDSVPPGPEPAAAEDSVEEILLSIWQEVLGRPVDRRDDFFEMGGHSLLAVQVISRVRSTLSLDLPLRALFEAPTVEGLAKAARAVVGEPEARGVPPLVRMGEPEVREVRSTDRSSVVVAPLSFAQRRLWFLDRLRPGDSSYNVAIALRVSGPLDVPRLQRSFDQVTRRHDMLRTRFPAPEGEPVQWIDEEALLELELTDLRDLDGTRGEEVLEELLREGAGAPFDLATGPLTRLLLMRTGDEEHVLLVVQHHIVTDAWSTEILVRELTELYRCEAGAVEARLPDLPVRYADYAAWQRRWLAGPEEARLLSFWVERLRGAPGLLQLPADHPRPPVKSFRGATVPVVVPEEVVDGVGVASRRHHVTRFMTLLAAFHALCARLSGQGDVSLGTPTAGRDRVEVEGLVGFFVNMLVIRVDLSDDPTVETLLGRVRERVLEAHRHHELPFERLVEALRPERDPGHTALFQVGFVLLEHRHAARRVGDLSLDPVEIEHGTSKFDANLMLQPGGSNLVGSFEYSTDLFDEATVRRFARSFEELVRGVTGPAGLRLSELPMIPEAERHQVLREWGSGPAPETGLRSIQETFRQQVARTPEAIALSASGLSLSYAALHARAVELAARLSAAGVGPEVAVGLAIGRSLDLVVAILAVLEAGGYYVPLDPRSPPEVLERMVEDAGSDVLVGMQADLERIPAGAARRIGFEAPEGRDLGTERFADAGPSALAYVMFTSGSTGRPKGVAVPHRAVLRLVRGASYARLGPEQTFLLLAPPAFDASTFEIWGPLLNGGRLAVFPHEMPSADSIAEVVARERVTTAWLTAGLFHLVVEERPDALQPMLQLLTGGEVLSPDHVERALEATEELRLVNGYGPTEGTTFTACHRIDGSLRRSSSQPVPIGTPIAGTSVFVADAGLRPMPVGVAGELCAGGAGLARGYAGRPAETAERFVPDPFGEPGGRAYRTGDLVRWLPEGRLDFVGRLDRQVKVRGFRVEPGEIEVALETAPEVDTAVVVSREQGGPGGGRILVAYVVPEDGRPVSPAGLRSFLGERLPSYMVPTAFVSLEVMPLTPNGKVDRAALPVPGAERLDLAVQDETAGPVEGALAEIWCDLLDLDRVGPNADFFDLGGHSLLATRLVSRVREVLGAEVPLRQVFEHPTPRGLAGVVEECWRPEGRRALPPLRPIPRGEPLPLSFAQLRLWVLDRLQPGDASYNVPAAYRLRGRPSLNALSSAVDRIVERHEALRTVFESVDDEPRQVVIPATAVPLAPVDLSGLPERLRAEEAERLAVREASRPFDLERGPLIRVGLLRLGAEEHIALVTMHHIVSDGWSHGLFVRELAELYTAKVENRPVCLPELSVQYRDFAHWERSLSDDHGLDEQLGYWRRKLASLPVLELPADRPRPKVRSFTGGREPLRFGLEVTRGLRSIARRTGATLFMVLLAGFKALLFRHTGQRDLVVGTNAANRHDSAVEPLIGFFVNMLVLRTPLDAGLSFEDLVRRVREVTLGAYTHQDVPFDRLVQELRPDRSLAHQPLFQVAFSLQNAPPSGVTTLPDLEIEPLSVSTETAKYDLVVNLWETERGLRGSLIYSRDLFVPETVRRLVERWRHLLEQAVEDPSAPLETFDLLSPAELDALESDIVVTELDEELSL